MIVPSIDLMNGSAVQLVGGRTLEIDAGDPRPIAQAFAIAGEIAVIDLDAALGQGNNRDVILELVSRADCRVGGGIRTVEAAIEWLDKGASKVILGTAARPEILRQLPKDRIIAALDADQGEVVVEGWRTGTGRQILERIAELKEYVGGFLVTFVEKEGRLGGTNLDQVAAIVAAAAPARVTIAGGITTAEEIAELDRMGADAQVGMALYSGRLTLGEAIAAPLPRERRPGVEDAPLWPTVVTDETGRALGLVYSNPESLAVAVERRIGAYWSRRRGLWIKGETSGATQELIRIDLDCDRDALRFTVRQRKGFCHTGEDTCWGDLDGLGGLEKAVESRFADPLPGSYTQRLATEPGLLEKKIREEADELCAEQADVAEEAADLLYFLAVKLRKENIAWSEVDRILSKRAGLVTRRAGDAKVGY